MMPARDTATHCPAQVRVIGREIGSMFPKIRRWFWIAFVGVGRLIAAEGDAQAPRRWQVEAADCDYLIQEHVQDASKQPEQPAEFLRLRAGAGTYVYAGHPLPPSQVVDDLRVSVWVKSDRRGVQLFGRVILPDTLDPETGRRASVLVAGQVYEQRGRWQRLQLQAIPLQLERQARVLRAKLRAPVDTRSAYLESAIVNIYGGPGTTAVWLGQPEPTGRVVPAARDGAEARTIGSNDPRTMPAASPERVTGRLIVAGRPFFPRAIEHRGEPLTLLRQLGFNTVVLTRAPSEAQQQQARELELWFVAPPSNQELGQNNDQRILGWFCGDDDAFHERPSDSLDQFRGRDPLRRPLIGAVQRDQWRASRQLDILLRIREPLGSSFELAHFGPWLDQMTQLTRPGTPFWCGVQTELSSASAEQAGGLWGGGGDLPRGVQVEQVRQLALAAVAAGARGLWFRSQTSLDAAGADAQLRRLMLELINDELALIEPWAVGGQRLGEVKGTNAELRVVALATERSRLLVPTYVQPFAQFVCQPTTGGNKLVIAGASDSTDVFQLSQVGLMPLKKQRISGGMRIELEAEWADSLLLLTEDPLVVNHINRTVMESRRRVVELEQELAERRLAEFETDAARKLLETPERVNRWDTARQSLQASRELSRVSDMRSAYRFARQANRELSRLQADVWRGMTAGTRWPLAQPAAASFALATAVNLTPTMYADLRPWSTNLLRGGDCENLDLMIAAGWRQHQTGPDDVGTYIALSPHQPHGGQSCLRILATAKTPEADRSVVESAVVWINSAPITVEVGQRVRISGWVRVDEPIRGSWDGCLIADSISGPPLGLRLRRTQGWESFQMTRTATRSDHLTVTITLQGLGEVWLDDLEVVVDQGPARISRK